MIGKMNTEHETLFTIVTVVLIITVYLFPTVISMFRNTKNGMGIFLLNLFFGWTLIGYVAAFIWAFTAKTVKEYNHIYNKN